MDVTYCRGGSTACLHAVLVLSRLGIVAIIIYSLNLRVCYVRYVGYTPSQHIMNALVELVWCMFCICSNTCTDCWELS
jgi:hypothetical protein